MKPATTRPVIPTLLLMNAAPVTTADKVGTETFIGWNLYHDSSVTCHGVGGAGTSLVPDLTESHKALSATEFEFKVLNRYLKARSMGAIGPGRPEIMKE